MADAAVESVLNNLKDLQTNHKHFIRNQKRYIIYLDRDIRMLRAFLRDLEKNRRNEYIQRLVRDIRDVVIEVEDIIDFFVAQATEIRGRNYFIRSFKSPVNLHSIHRMVRNLIDEVQRNFDQISLTITEENNKRLKDRPPRKDGVVGFVDVTTALINQLTTETEYFDVISLIGMFGLGKTTVAWKIFNDPQILDEFSIRVWLSVSQQFSNKGIFLAILENFTTLTDDLRLKDEQVLCQLVADFLEKEKFLIVMDDVWSLSDWERLKAALPENNMKGKVLVTSCEVKLGTYASRPRPFHKLRFFTPEESWELLCLEALVRKDCPPELRDVGQRIATDCNGLPLAIVVIGGILATKYSATHIGETRRAWDKVSQRVGAYLNEDPQDRMNKFISLSYDKLPYHLRTCFLYLGLFPEDHIISVSKLIRMWIGEGFVQQNKKYSLEETAEKYLEDLINRNLVRIEKIKLDGKVKTCRIPDTLRAFCRNEAGNGRADFFVEVKSSDGGFTPPISEIPKYRRLSIHSNCLNFFSSKPFGPQVRTFVSIPKDDYTLPEAEADSSAIPAAFKLVKVLDVKSIKFTTIPTDMYQLVHLRFITLSFSLNTLPEKFSKLWNLQTLIVETTSRTLYVKADIWKMKRLRHFKINASASLPKPSSQSERGVELQTLGKISAESCTAEILHQASKLKKLGIHGRLALLLEGKIGSFNSLGRMRNLEKLKLINDVYPDPPSQGQCLVLPQPYQFPSTLRSLTICATFFNWSYMSTIGLLENLEALKLMDSAFMGRTWEGVDGGFRRLQFLLIDHTDLVVWEASSHHFPRLKCLVLQNCEKLVGIPEELAGIQSLQMLDLVRCRYAAASARKIHEAKKNKGCALKLSIFPASE